MFVPALLALLPGQLRWMHVIPVEGLLGRVVGDVLIHYLNLVGAYIVCATMVAVRLVSLNGILILGDSAMGSDTPRVCHGSVESLQGLAGGPAQEKSSRRNSISGGSRSRW